MRILFLSFYSGWIERGVENYATELVSRLNSKYDVMVLQSGPVKDGQRFRRRVPVRMEWPPDLSLTWKRKFYVDYYSRMIVEFSFKAIREIGRFKPEIIYPLNGGWMSLICKILSKFIGAKLVVGGHAGIGRDDRWNLYMLPDLFIAFSKKGEEWARKVNPFIKIVRIPHGVNLEKFNPEVKPAKVDLERPIFITVSHLVPYKRVGETIKAVAELKKGSLLVLGEGPEAEKIDELGKKLLNNLDGIATPRRGGARNDSETRRYLRLQVPYNQVARYLRAADVFTLVSEESEAFGLVYLEAMGCNLPVVASDDSLRRELIGDHAKGRAGAGLFVKNPKDSQEYARCLETAAKINWGNRPARQAKKFDWEKIAERYLEEFKGI